MAFRAGSVGRVLAVTAAVLCPEARAQQPADIPVVRLDVTGAAPSSQLPALPVTRLDARSRATDLDGVRAVSLTFSEPLPVRDVLLMLFRGTSFSIVFEPGVTGKFIGELSDLTLRQALEAVLFPVSVDYSLEGTVVRAFARRPETRLFEVSHLAVQRESRRRVRALTPDGLAAAADLSTATPRQPMKRRRRRLRSPLFPRSRPQKCSALRSTTRRLLRNVPTGFFISQVARPGARFPPGVPWLMSARRAECLAQCRYGASGGGREKTGRWDLPRSPG